MSTDFFESFDTGIGALTNRWGGGIDTSVRGQVTISGTSGIMETPWGAAAGHGYGTYTIVAKLNGDAPGSAGLLWPADDVWPGPEMDIVEFIGGHPYGTLHWQGANGRDAWASKYYDSVDAGQVHTYSLDWEPGRVTFYVDGRSWGSFTDHVARDYAHGGVNMTISVMNSSPHTSITVYEVSYHASGGQAVAAETVETGSAGTGSVVAGPALDAVASNDTINGDDDSDASDAGTPAAAPEASGTAPAANWGWGWGHGWHGWNADHAWA